jgi:hypothetical protein
VDVAAEIRRLRELADVAPARLLYALCALGVPDVLADGARTTARLAEQAGADPSALERVLRAAACLGVVAADEDAAGGDRTWRLLPAGRLLCASHPGGLHAEFADNDLFTMWTEFLYTVRTGRPCYPRVFGAPLFARLAAEPQALRAFHRHMHERARQVYGSLLRLPVWPREGVVVDLAGGTGGLLEQLLLDRPALSGVLHDLREVLDLSTLRADFPGRVTLAEGDIFRSPLPAGDTYVLASVLHDWPDDAAGEILRRCRDACGRRGVLLVAERVLPESGHHPGFFNDLLILAGCGGTERTLARWRGLLGAAGFDLRAVHEADDTELAVLECVPARPRT